jgi:hypothetical protein
MIISKLWQSIRHNKKLWLTSIAIAVLATFVTNSPAGGNTMVTTDNSIRQSIAPPTRNGVYLYGESDQPDLVGKEYIVFETIGTKIIGAIYLPQSEFSCFYGHFRGARMNVTLIDIYDRQQSKFTLALNANRLTASKQPTIGAPTYQPLGKISNNDRRILNACKLQLPNRY